MNKFLITVIRSCLLLLVSHLGLTVVAAQQSAVTTTLNRMEKAHLEMKSLRAELFQQKTNAQIGVSDNEYGTFIYKPSAGQNKGKLRIDYTRPSKDIIALVGDNVVFYQPRINQVFKSTLAKAAKGKVSGYSQLIGLDGSVKSLAGNYSIEIVGDEVTNGQKTTILRLTPKGAKTSGQYAAIDIWVSQQSWLPVQWKLVERNGDFTIVSLRNVQLNGSIPDSAFNVTIPSGVKVVDKI
ncbi:MAG: LolA family protein [Blastocatellia bacterium]